MGEPVLNTARTKFTDQCEDLYFDWYTSHACKICRFPEDFEVRYIDVVYRSNNTDLTRIFHRIWVHLNAKTRRTPSATVLKAIAST